ncbi:MAG: oligosaccharide repeat unit polymerase [Bacteroidales bacterium]|jgi:oligosaccharide repeat unit polymerase|nr:oligosaccharide repeat unit polymerase [Bacteroidales bacterium]
MIKILFAILVMALCFVVNTKKKQTFWAPSNIVLGLYLLVVLCAIPFAFINKDTAIFSSHYSFHTIVFLFYILLFILPFSTIKETHIHTLVLPNKKIIRVTSLIIIALSLYAIFFFVSGVVNVFSYGDLGAARNARYEHDMEFVEGGIMYTIASVSSSLYSFAIVFFFISTIIKEKKWIRLMLLVGSFSEVLHILTEVGRDGALFWLFTFVFCFLFFKPFLGEQEMTNIKKLFIIMGGIVSVPFLMITIGRFGDDAQSSFFTYFGQQFSQACYTIDLDPLPVTPGKSFPLYFEIIGEPMPIPKNVSGGLIEANSFATFLRAFLTNFGYGGTLFLGVVLAFIVTGMSKVKKGVFYLYSMFIYMLFFQVYSQGVFYFRQYHRGGNLFIVLCFVFYFLFKFIQRNFSCLRINR